MNEGTQPNHSPAGAEALAIARDLFAAGTLRDVTGVRLLAARKWTGAATVDLVLEAPIGPALLVPVGTDVIESPDRLGARLLSAASNRHDGAAILGAAAGASDILRKHEAESMLQQVAVVAAGGPRRSAPVMAFFLNARGADASTQTIRLEAAHPHGFDSDISRMMDRHRLACAVAADRASRGVAWEADGISLAVIREAGLDPAGIVDELRRRPSVTIALPGADEASLLWRDFVLTADILLRAGRRLDRGRLSIEGLQLPGAILASMHGRSLRDLLTIHAVLDEVTVDRAWMDSGELVVFALAPERFVFPARADERGRP